MLQKKIALVGPPAITGFVRHCMYSIFSESYFSTIGVMVHRKHLNVNRLSLNLLVWEMPLGDEFESVRASFLRGMSGYVVVVDPTDESLRSTIREFHQLAKRAVGMCPFLTIAINKDTNAGKAEVEITTGDSSGLGRTADVSSSSGRRLLDSGFQQLAQSMLA